jgi:hypothetical protein
MPATIGDGSAAFTPSSFPRKFFSLTSPHESTHKCPGYRRMCWDYGEVSWYLKILNAIKRAIRVFTGPPATLASSKFGT